MQKNFSFFFYFRLYFNRNNRKIHLEILKTLQKVFPLLPSITNNDHLIPSESVLFTLLKLFVAILSSYYPDIIDDILFSSIKFDQDFIIEELILQLLDEYIKLCITNESK